MEFNVKFNIDWPENRASDKKMRSSVLKALKKGDYARLAQTAKNYLSEDTEAFNQAVKSAVEDVTSFIEADMKKRRRDERVRKLFDVTVDLLDTLKTGA